ncbi:MAG: hypothetical protein ACE5GL_05360 [Calditrichia bacterium]
MIHIFITGDVNRNDLPCGIILRLSIWMNKHWVGEVSEKIHSPTAVFHAANHAEAGGIQPMYANDRDS